MDLAIKTFGHARGFGLNGPSGSATITQFVPAISQLFGQDSYIPIIRDSRRAREDMVNTDGTGLR